MPFAGTGTVVECTIERNAQNGLLVMDNASASVRSTVIRDNGGYGVCTRDGEVGLEDSELRGNRLGSLCNRS